MNIKQLLYFTTIAEEKQITRAAKKLHIAQPPLSHQLKLLEEELGVLLLERNGKEMELTDAGKLLFRRGKAILENIKETRNQVQEVGEGIRGVLSIGSVKTCFSYIPERIKLFREKHPLLRFRLFEGDSFRLADYLRRRDIELAIVRMPLEMADFDFIHLPRENFVAIVPGNWTSSHSIDLKELADMPLMLLHRVSGWGLYELVIDACNEQNLQPTIICECPDAAMLLSLVKSGVGITLLPESTLRSFPLNGLKAIKIKDATIETDSAVIWLKDRYLSKSAKHFLETFNQDRQSIAGI